MCVFPYILNIGIYMKKIHFLKFTVKVIKFPIKGYSFVMTLLWELTKKKLTFLADMSVKEGGGVQYPCPLRKCKFLLGGENFLELSDIFAKKTRVFMHEKKIFLLICLLKLFLWGRLLKNVSFFSTTPLKLLKSIYNLILTN